MSRITRLFATTALLVALAGTVYVLAERSHVLMSLMPVALYGDSVGRAIMIRPIIAAVSVVAMIAYRLFFGPGPPKTLRSVRNAIIRGCGAGRKARAFLKKATIYRAKLMKMRVRMYSRFHIA